MKPTPSLRFGLSSSIFIAILVLMLVLLPLLYYLLIDRFQRVTEEQFVLYANETSGLIADSLSGKSYQRDYARITQVVDTAILAGNVSYIDMYRHGKVIYKPEFLKNDSDLRYREDRKVGGNRDSVYYLSVPVYFSGPDSFKASLRIGFDESSVLQEQSALSRHAIYLLLGYFFLMLLLVSFVVRLIMRPLGMLRQQSREIADGNLEKPIRVETFISDIHHLASDLDAMRDSLTDLAQEMHYKATHDDLTGLPNRYPGAQHW